MPNLKLIQTWKLRSSGWSHKASLIVKWMVLTGIKTLVAYSNHALSETDQILHWLTHVEDETFESYDSLYCHHNPPWKPSIHPFVFPSCWTWSSFPHPSDNCKKKYTNWWDNVNPRKKPNVLRIKEQLTFTTDGGAEITCSSDKAMAVENDDESAINAPGSEGIGTGESQRDTWPTINGGHLRSLSTPAKH